MKQHRLPSSPETRHQNASLEESAEPEHSSNSAQLEQLALHRGQEGGDEAQADLLAEQVLAWLNLDEDPGPQELVEGFQVVAGVNLSGVRVQSSPALAPLGLDGLVEDGEAQVAQGLDPQARLYAQAHELAHAALGHEGPRFKVSKGAASGSVPKPWLEKGDRGDEVLKLQRALLRLGHLSREALSTGPGVFGERTEAALRAFQRAERLVEDGVYGTQCQTALAAKSPSNEGTKPQTPAEEPAEEASWKDADAPKDNYKRVWFRGVQMNKRTQELLMRAEDEMQGSLGHKNFEFSLSQGSYNTGVSASAGTHDGGGALDIRVRGLGTRTVDHMVQALRRAGFAAWSRGRGHDSFDPHIHAIAIGDKEAQWLAKHQVAEYAKGGDGLSGSREDPDKGLGRDVPDWAKDDLRYARRNY